MNETSTILADEAAQFLGDNPTITNTDTIFTDISGIARGKRLPAGNVCDAVDTGWPMHFDEALRVMRDGPPLSEYLGANFVRLYTACKKLDLDTFEREINRLECVSFLSPE